MNKQQQETARAALQEITNTLFDDCRGPTYPEFRVCSVMVEKLTWFINAAVEPTKEKAISKPFKEDKPAERTPKAEAKPESNSKKGKQ